MKLLILIFFFSIRAFSEELIIEFPDHEKKTYNIPEDGELIPKIQSKAWTCSVAKRDYPKDPAVKAKGTFTRAFGCFKGKDQIATIIVCQNETKESDMGMLVLTEGGKKTTFFYKCQ
jgi:hypothetical protein